MNYLEINKQHKYYIKTNRSALSAYIITDKEIELVGQAIQEIDNELISNLPIVIYGKECFQRRAIGFFSNYSSSILMKIRRDHQDVIKK